MSIRSTAHSLFHLTYLFSTNFMFRFHRTQHFFSERKHVCKWWVLPSTRCEPAGQSSMSLSVICDTVEVKGIWKVADFPETIIIRTVTVFSSPAISPSLQQHKLTFEPYSILIFHSHRHLNQISNFSCFSSQGNSRRNNSRNNTKTNITKKDFRWYRRVEKIQKNKNIIIAFKKKTVIYRKGQGKGVAAY